MSLSNAAIAAIRKHLLATPHGHRTDAVAELAKHFRVSVATIYRYAGLRGAARNKRRNNEYRDWTKTIVALASRAPKPISLDLALESAVRAGVVPAEAARMPISTAYRIRREEGLAERPRRTQAMCADYPMQAIQFDGSTSAHLVCRDPLDDGDYLLELHKAPTPAGGYKNKPLDAHRLRVFCYGIWDMATGYTRATYSVARGENSLGGIKALHQMLSETGDPRRPLHGIPDHLWSDQGPVFKAELSSELIDRLGIDLIVGEAYKKERMGGVERSWRTLWQRFERSLFLDADLRHIRLSEIQARLQEFERRENALRLSRTNVGGRPASRAAAWVALTNGRPADNPLRRMPTDALETLHRAAPRRVDRSGIVRLDGEKYEVTDPVMYSCWVTVRQALHDPDDTLVLEGRDGRRAIAVRCRPRPYGQVRAIPATPLEQFKAEDAGAPVPGVDPYRAQDDEAPGAIPMTARSSDAAPLDNPLDVGRHRSLEQAMAHFHDLYSWPLTAVNRGDVERLLLEAGLKKTAVVDLAAELVKLAGQDD